MIHSTSEVQSKSIGNNTDIWQYVVILSGAEIGDFCNINCHVFIENDVVVGNNVTIKSGVQLWDGLRIGDGVFIGPNATFINDKRPRSKNYSKKIPQTWINVNASIGGGSTILSGITVGSHAMVGAGAVITKNVPDRALVVGNPGKVVGWLNKDGSKMRNVNGHWIDSKGQKWKVENKKIVHI